MDRYPSDFRPSPRRELALQGPRPTPLKVNKDSHKIKKPPIAPQPRSNFQAVATAPAPAYQQQRQPVIIYAVSPKILHTKPSDFMTLVQRLTGPDSTADTSVADLTLPSPAAAGALSPAARIATFEKSSPSSHVPDHHYVDLSRVEVDEFELTGGLTLDRPTSIPGILSPLPSSLPPISPAFFSPNFDPSILSFLQDLSPAFANNNNENLSNYNNSLNYNCSSINTNGSNNTNNTNNRGLWDVGSNLMTSPSNNLLLTPLMPSPGAWGEFFNQFPDL